MGYDPNATCPTPSCIEWADKHQKGAHRVTDTEFHEHPQCDNCGGKLINGVWVHKCRQCNKDVEPGKLHGLFVPHLCSECYKGRQQTDRKCGICHKPYIDCWC